MSHTVTSRFLSPLALPTMQDPGFLQSQFRGMSILSYFLHPVKSIFTKSFSTSSNRQFLGFPTATFPSGVFLHTLLTVRSSDILSTCPRQTDIDFPTASIQNTSLLLTYSLK